MLKWFIFLFFISGIAYGDEILYRDSKQVDYVNSYYIKDCFLFHTTIPKSRLSREHMVFVSSINLRNSTCDIHSHQSGRKQLECICKDQGLCVANFGIYMPEGERDPFIETSVAIQVTTDKKVSMDKLIKLKTRLSSIVNQCKNNN